MTVSNDPVCVLLAVSNDPVCVCAPEAQRWKEQSEIIQSVVWSQTTLKWKPANSIIVVH